MDELNDDALMEIFVYFKVNKRILLEQVCQRWRRLIRRMFSGAKVVNVAEYMSMLTAPIYNTHYQQDHIAFVPTAVGLISHCGPYVKELNFGRQWLKISQPIIDVSEKEEKLMTAYTKAVEANCSELTSLDLSGCIVDGTVINLLSKLAPQLRTLLLDEVTFVDSESIQQLHNLFYRFIHLKRLGLMNGPYQLRRLTDLPTELESINLENVRYLPRSTFLQFLTTHNNIRELRLSAYQELDQSIVEKVGQQERLEKLQFSFMMDDNLDLGDLGTLSKLTELDLHNCNALNTLGFQQLCSQIGRQLVKINLISCKRVFDFRPLGECTNLLDFKIGQTYQISDEDLGLLAQHGKLETLEITSCHNITNYGIALVAEKCPLKDCTILKCQEISDGALIALADYQTPAISLQHCQITSTGIQAMANLKSLEGLKEVDVSYNRGVSDDGIMALYLAFQRFDQLITWDAEGEKKPNDKNTISNNGEEKEKFRLYAHQTNVSKDLQHLVKPYFNLVF